MEVLHLIRKYLLKNRKEKYMTEKEKAQKGYLYDANYDKDLAIERARCKDLCFKYNMCAP